MHSKNRIKYRTYFIHFTLYNLIFFALQLIYILFKSGTFLNAVAMPLSVYIELCATLVIHLCLYLLLSALQTLLLWGVDRTIRLNQISASSWQLMIWIFSIGALLTINGYFFPLSLFSRLLFLSDLPSTWLVGLCIALLTILALLTLNTLFWAGKQFTKTIVLLISIISLYMCWPSQSTTINTNNKNIILIGVDSLPPSAINKKNTPTISQFVHHSTLFQEAISPLARTFPAWTSILTGLNPSHHGARYNLMPSRFVKADKSIAWDLKRAGWDTIYGTDDRRFNSIGKEFGFQQIIGPKLGVNDMLIGTFNDFPISNLLVNFPFTRWIFPYNYINRASHYVYYPQTFDNALEKTLRLRKQTKPLLLAVHFTLPHWPYAFASSTPAQVKNEYSVMEREHLFFTAIHQADNQVNHLLQTLKTNGYLENSLVILLSDHGEALYSEGSRQTKANAYQGPNPNKLADYFKRKTSTTLDRSAGHGSDLLSKDQYHCLLSFALYKENKPVNLAKIISTRVALIDIAPTIWTYLNPSYSPEMDGVSLFKTLVDENESLPERTFTMESGMLPNQFLSQEKARQLGQKYFRVNPNNGQLELRRASLATLDTLKLYALIRGDWVLAFYPDDHGYIPITQRISDGAWTDELESDFSKLSVLHHWAGIKPKMLGRGPTY